jgi:hypothetical protein
MIILIIILTCQGSRKRQICDKSTNIVAVTQNLIRTETNRFVTKEFYNHPDVQMWMKNKNYKTDHQYLNVLDPIIQTILTEQFEMAEWFMSILPNNCYTILFWGATLGYEAARCMLPYDDDVDLLIDTTSLNSLHNIWKQSEPVVELPIFYKNERNISWTIRSFYNHPSIWICKRKNAWKLLNKNNRVYGEDIGGLDLFSFNYLPSKIIVQPTIHNTIEQTICGYKLKMFTSQVARKQLDIVYGPTWRLKILSKYLYI